MLLRGRIPVIWRNRDYMILWGGQLISVMGSGASGVAALLLVFSLTHSAADMGIVSALFGLPYPVVGLIAGGLVDRWDRKMVMLVTNGGMLVCSASIPVAIWLHVLTFGQLCVVAFLTGTFFVFFNVAEFAALPSIVPESQFPAATAQNQATQGVAGLVGPPLGGSLFQAARGLPFVADAVSYAVAFVSLLFVRASFRVERTSTQNLAGDIKEGLQWLWGNQIIRTLTLLTAGTNLLNGGIDILVIVLARRTGASPAVIGAIFAIGALGGIAGSIAGPWFQKRLTLRTTSVSFFWGLAVIMPLYLIAPDALAVGVITALFFMTGPIYNVAFQTYRLSLIPPSLLGRVNGSGRVVAWGAVPVGGALTGLALQSIGPEGTIWAIALCYVILAGAATVTSAFRGAGTAPLPRPEVAS